MKGEKLEEYDDYGPEDDDLGEEEEDMDIDEQDRIVLNQYLSHQSKKNQNVEVLSGE